MMHWGGDFGMGYGFSWIFMILFWTLVILVTVYLVKALLRGGSAEDKITFKSAPAEGITSISDKIIEELGTGSYDMILLPKHNQTHTQEFPFGDIAVQLL